MLHPYQVNVDPQTLAGKRKLTQCLIEKKPGSALEGGPPGRPLRGCGAADHEDEGGEDVDGQPDDGDEVRRHPQREQAHNPGTIIIVTCDFY